MPSVISKKRTVRPEEARFLRRLEGRLEGLQREFLIGNNNMPEAVIFNYQNKIHTVYFTQAKAMLPVRLKNGDIKLVAWGRRENENSEMPLGGWARLASIKNDKDQRWNLYLPKPVQIQVDKFMEKDFEGKSCWYEVTKGKCIQGLLASLTNEYRLYIVTVDPEDLTNCHYRWPHIINCAMRMV